MNLLRRNFDSNAEIYACDDKWKIKFGRFLTVVGQKERLADEMFKFVFGWVLEVSVNIVLGVEWFSK